MAHVVLVTRPQPAADSFAARLRGRETAGAQIVVSPLMQRQVLPGAVPDLGGYCGLVVTSAAALEALTGRGDLAGKRCYCVGRNTARKAADIGLAAVAGGGTASELEACILAQSPRGKLLYLRGEHVSKDLAKALNSAGIETDEAVVYAQIAQPLTAHAEALLDQGAPVVLPLFSARTARLFFESYNPRASLHIAAISANVASAIPPGSAEKLVTADAPTEDSMLDAVSALESHLNRLESGGREH